MDNNLGFWQRIAKLYAPLQEKTNKELYIRLCNLCKAHINNKCNVLELACGTGQISLPLCDCAKSWTATDFSPKMIEELKKKKNENSSLFCAVQDATKLEYDDELFDIVIIANALHIMPEPQNAMNEIERVLNDEGLLIAPTFIFDGTENKLKLWFMDKIGFHTFYKWSEDDYCHFITSSGFEILEKHIVKSSSASECFLVARKQKR